MFISLQGTKWHGTKLYTGLMCAGVNCLYPLCSPLRNSWRPGHPSYQTASRESSIQRRRSCGVEQSAAGYSYCINTRFFQKSAQDSSIFSFISIINLISRSVCCTAPFMDMLRHLISRRIIIIIIIIIKHDDVRAYALGPKS